MRTAALALVAVAGVACGGKENNSCPSGYICTPVQDGGPSSSGNGGATVVTSGIQQTATNLASDGTSLFWSSSVGNGSGISSLPVGGGTPNDIVPPPATLLGVDDVNVYYQGGSSGEGLYRAAKGGGGSSTLISDPNAIMGAPGILGSTIYWVERTASTSPTNTTWTVKSAPLQGGAVSTITEFVVMGPYPFTIGVTTTTGFLSSVFNPGGSTLSSFPLSSGVPDGGTPASVSGVTDQCSILVSDTDAVYCNTGVSMLSIASDGTVTTLGSVVDQGQEGSGVAFDETYVYWADSTTVGTIMQVPKAGGTATVIAHDTQPLAVAVDANNVYWSDVGGNIMRIAK